MQGRVSLLITALKSPAQPENRASPWLQGGTSGETATVYAGRPGTPDITKVEPTLIGATPVGARIFFIPASDSIINSVNVLWKDAADANPGTTINRLVPIDITDATGATKYVDITVGAGGLPRAGRWSFALQPGMRHEC